MAKFNESKKFWTLVKYTIYPTRCREMVQVSTMISIKTIVGEISADCDNNVVAFNLV